MRLDDLNKLWETAAPRPIAPEMSFDGDFLVLGAQTRLAKAGAALDEPRLIALLAAAHGRPIAASPLRHVQRALEKKRDADLVLALIHLALSGLTKIRDPKEGARRLCLPDALISGGVDSASILRKLGIGDHDSLDKYSPDQPRVPAGNGRASGQWTNGDWTAEAPDDRQTPGSGVQVADASSTRGHEVMSDATLIAYALGP
jgi:hypothetical protein